MRTAWQHTDGTINIPLSTLRSIEKQHATAAAANAAAATAAAAIDAAAAAAAIDAAAAPPSTPPPPPPPPAPPPKCSGQPAFSLPGKAAKVASRQPGAADPPWLKAPLYSRKQRYLLHHFGWQVVRTSDGQVGIIKAVCGDDVTIEWGLSVAPAAAGKRAAHSLITQKATIEDRFEREVKKGVFALIDPHDDPFSMVSILTCGPLCSKCQHHLGVGAEAWTECWQCGLPEAGSHAGCGSRYGKGDPNRYVPSNLTCASDDDSESESD
jgi:hypothetical protein